MPSTTASPPFRVLIALAAVVLIAAACGGTSGASGAPSAPAPGPTDGGSAGDAIVVGVGTGSVGDYLTGSGRSHAVHLHPEYG